MKGGTFKSWVVLGSLGLVSVVTAQSVAFQDDFQCSNVANFGTKQFGWESNYVGDMWQTNLDELGITTIKGVSPQTITLNGGAFGGVADPYENFLLAGHPLFKNMEITADIINKDDDGVGLVARYQSPDSYYLCTMSNHRVADCDGNGGSVAFPRLAVHKVKTSQSCSSNYESSFVPFTYQYNKTYRMKLLVKENPQTNETQVVCTVDTNLDNVADVIVQLIESTPASLPSGMAGILSWDSGAGDNALTQLGQPAKELIYDNVGITTFDPDSDKDGVPNAIEALVGTNPNKADSDNDTILDSEELLFQKEPLDSDNDGTIDALDTDSDNDGIPDSVEAGDNDPNTRPVDANCNGFADFRDITTGDLDNDGLGDALEQQYGTNPNNPDSDGDGLKDGEEVFTYETNPANPDTDGDGLKDGKEVNTHHTDPKDPDTDNDGLKDGKEVNTHHTDPLDADTDNGGVIDGNEVLAGTDPLDGSDDYPSDDNDHDGLPNDSESQIGTDPNNPDTDGDGLKDGEEYFDYNTDPLDPDTDGDGLKDGAEVNTHHTDPLDPDTDKGGVSDGNEVLRDSTDPLYGADDKVPADCDKDGLEDDLEAILGSDKCNADSDGDGVNDFVERKASSQLLKQDLQIQGSGLSCATAQPTEFGIILSLVLASLLPGLRLRRSNHD